MWPLLLDMTKEESIQNLRNLELEAYSNLVSALRAQGPLNSDKRKLLKDTGYVLNITQERHKAEVRRAISDEKLTTIAYHITGHTESSDDWAQEGRRIVPLLPRTAPQTIYTAVANEASDAASQSNKLLPLPVNTERKRPIITPVTAVVVPETSKNASFRIPDPPKPEETKKRKLVGNMDNPNITQHLLTPKLCRIQQLYRQRSKPKTKDIIKKAEQEHLDIVQQHRIIQPLPQTVTCSSPQPQFINQRVNVLQNISLQPIKEDLDHEETEFGTMKIDQAMVSQVPVCSNENQAPKPKILTNVKPNTNITIKQTSPQPAGPSGEVQKTIKMCPAKKPITKTVNSGQKLIVVSNAQTIPSSSILQRTLQIPFVKNISIKNFEKFKIVTSNSTPTNLQLTNVTNSGVNSVKHKVVTVKTNQSSKKVIPFSQLQVLNSKGSIKVLPLGGKIVGKSVAGNPSPLYIVNTTQQFTKVTPSQVITTSKLSDRGEAKVDHPDVIGAPISVSSRENGKSSVLEDILKASGVISDDVVEDYDAKIEEFHISQVKRGDGDECMEVRSEYNEEMKVEEGEIARVVPEDKVIVENVESDIVDEMETSMKLEVASNEIIESESSLHISSMSEEITTEEVPIDMMIDIGEAKISDTECN